MARLPIVHGDQDAWGDILNTFLSVEFNGDGTLANVARPAALAAETAARISGDSTEAAARAAADTAEATARAAADAAHAALTVTAHGGITPPLIPTGVKTTAYAAAAQDLVPVDTTGGAVTITLPTAPADNSRIVVKHVIQGGTNAVTVVTGGSDVFNKTGGATSLTLPLLNQGVVLQYKLSTGIWYVVSDDLALSTLDARYGASAGSIIYLGASNGTDDTTTLQTALNNYRTVVLLPGQNYKISSALLLNTSGTRLVGYGATITQLTVAENGISAATTAIVNCVIEGLTLVGANTVAQSGQWGISVADQSRIRGCNISGFNVAMRFVGPYCNASFNYISNAIGTGSGQGYGVLVMASDCTVSNNIMTNIGRHGVYCSGDATFGGASRCSVTGNTIYLNGSGADGIKVYSSPTLFPGETALIGGSITGNTVVHTSPQAGAAVGIGLYEAVTDWVVSGNTCVGFNSAGLKAGSTPQAGGPTRVAFVGNSLDGSGFFIKMEPNGANKPADCSAIGNVSNINSTTGLSNGGTGTSFLGNTGPGLAYADVKPAAGFTANVATPSTYNGNVFKTQNSSPTTITNFTDGKPGQVIVVLVDANTTIANNSNIKLAGAVNFVGAADVLISFYYDGTVWREISRTGNGRTAASNYVLTSDGTTVKAFDEFGNLKSSGTDGGAVLTAILPAASSAGATIDFRNDGNVFPWSTVPQLPKGITNLLLIRGNGATVQLSSGGPRFLDFHRTADYDTFQNVEVGGFVIDCNSVDQPMHTIIGNRDNAGGTPNDQRVNIDKVYVHDVRVINVPYTAGNRSAISFGCHHLASGETQTNLTNIRVERIRIEGGPAGIAISGGVSPFNAATAVNVFYDNIWIEGIYHNTGASRANGTGYTIQIGQNGFGGRVTIRNVESLYSPDVIVELDACQTGLVENVRGKNNSGGGFLVTNFRAPENIDTQRIDFVDCHVRQDDATNTAGSTFVIAANNSIAIGTVAYTNCAVYKNLAEVKNNIGIMLEAASGSPVVRAIILDKCQATHDGLSTTAGGALYGIHLQGLSGPSGPCDVKVRNCAIRYNGTYTSGTKPSIEAFTVMNASANVAMNIDGFDVDIAVAGYAADFATNIIALNRSGGYTVSGSIRRLRVIALTSDTGAQAITVGTTTNCIISPAPLLVSDCDFSAMANAREFRVDATQAAIGAVLANSNRWKTNPAPVSFTGLVTATGKILGTAGAGVVWKAAAQFTQGSGTSITAVDYSTNGGTTYTNLLTQASGALPAGTGPIISPLRPGDLIKATFTGTQPTITLVPVDP